MYDGTLATKGPWQALVTFQQLIILCDKTGIVDITAEAIARRTTIPLDIIAAGIEALEQPDSESRSPALEGRRIVRLSDERTWGWQIVNYEHYRKLRSHEERREYMREYQRKRRGIVNNSVNKLTARKQCNPSSKQYAVSNKTTTAGKPALPDGFEECWKAYPKRAGDNPKNRAQKAYSARLKAGDTPEAILAGTMRYSAFVQAQGRVGTEFVKQAATFFGPDRSFAEDWTIEKTPQAEESRWWLTHAGIENQGRALGIETRPGESYDDYAARIRRSQRETQS